MANKSVFAPTRGHLIPATDCRNRAGGPAYAYGAKQALAQLAMTGTFSDTFYVDGSLQLEQFASLSAKVDPVFLAQAAIYTRREGYMKDTPAYLLAALSRQDPTIFAKAFGRVIDNGKMLRTFTQIMRSGATGRKSLGTRPKRMIQDWLLRASDAALLRAAVEQDPSLADVIKMVHPKADGAARNALFAWLIGKPAETALLPQAVQDYLRFKENGRGILPDVPFQMLTALSLTTAHWAQIARRGAWQMVRMNLQTFARQGVFTLPEMDQVIARKLADAEQVRRSRAMPYQLMVTYAMADEAVPPVVRQALAQAMAVALENVPAFEGSCVVCPDVSGSMSAPVTGYRKGASSKVRCIDVAGLIAAAVMHRNPASLVLPFDHQVHEVRLPGCGSVLDNAQVLAGFGGGATVCLALLAWLNQRDKAPDLVVFVSDNQSWMDRQRGRGTTMMAEWQALKSRNPKAKLVCIDIAPYGTTQAKSRDDILNVGGFSDSVFKTIAAFASGTGTADHWVSEIETIEV